MKIFVVHPSSIDFWRDLYEPLRSSPLFVQHNFVFPQEHGPSGERSTRKEILSSDLILAEVSKPSTGSGIEIGWANSAGIPIIALFKKGETPARSAAYVTDVFIEYTDGADLCKKLELYIRTTSR